MKNNFYKPGKRGQRKDGWFSAWSKPSGKLWKRIANKKARRANVADGNAYRKVWGWFEWC